MIKGPLILNWWTHFIFFYIDLNSNASFRVLLTFNIISRNNGFIGSVLLEDLQFTVLATEVLQNTLKLRSGVFLQPPGQREDEIISDQDLLSFLRCTEESHWQQDSLTVGVCSQRGHELWVVSSLGTGKSGLPTTRPRISRGRWMDGGQLNEEFIHWIMSSGHCDWSGLAEYTSIFCLLADIK